MTPLERAKEAIAQSIVAACAQRGGSCNGTPEGLLAVDATFDPALIARAVLEAIREPSEGMKRAGEYDDGTHPDEGPGKYISEDDAKEAYQRMIDAALSEGG